MTPGQELHAAKMRLKNAEPRRAELWRSILYRESRRQITGDRAAELRKEFLGQLRNDKATVRNHAAPPGRTPPGSSVGPAFA